MTLPTGPTILLLVTTFDIGGAERVYIHLARGLSRKGYHVIAACLQARSGAVARELAGSGVQTVDLAAAGNFDLRVLWRLVGLLRRRRVGVVYTFLIHAHLIGRVAARMTGIPVVLSSQQIMSWEGPWLECLNRLTARWCTAVVGVSREVESYLAERVRIPRRKLRTIYNCVDVSGFDCRPRSPRSNTPPVIGSVARLNPEKDHATLLEALRLVCDHHPRALLLLAGGGPERSRLEQRVAALALTDNVRFLGHVEDVRSVYTQLDIFVQSSHMEGLSVAVLEALASCLPVVAAKVGGNAEAIQDGKSGLLVPPRDPRALAAAMLWLIDNPAEAARFGECGRRHVERVFSAEAMVESTDRLIEELRSASLAGAK